jgi:hypothetical protein
VKKLELQPLDGPCVSDAPHAARRR